MKSPLLALLCLFTVGSTSFAADTHYVTFFGVQDFFNSFEGAHTFAAFTKISDDKMETNMISWLPYSGPVCLFCEAERGRNFPLKESIEEALERGAKVSAWGPFKIKPELYARAKARSEFLEAGKILYKAVDEPQRFDAIATNCEHAVSDVDIDNGYLHTGIAHGNRGTWMVAKHLKKWMLGTQIQENIYKRLGLNFYPITRRAL